MDNLITTAITRVGTIVVCLGGTLIGIALAGFACFLACNAWVCFSNRFRDVCKAESMIHEYRRNRVEFLAWKAFKDGDSNGA